MDYFIFWSVVTLILVILGGVVWFRLFSTLKSIQEILARIEHLLNDK